MQLKRHGIIAGRSLAQIDGPGKIEIQRIIVAHPVITGNDIRGALAVQPGGGFFARRAAQQVPQQGDVRQLPVVIGGVVPGAFQLGGIGIQDIDRFSGVFPVFRQKAGPVIEPHESGDVIGQRAVAMIGETLHRPDNGPAAADGLQQKRVLHDSGRQFPVLDPVPVRPAGGWPHGPHAKHRFLVVRLQLA